MPDGLTSKRFVAANTAFKRYEFCGRVCEMKVWQQKGDCWERKFWIAAPETAAGKIPQLFVVKFKPNTADIAECYDANLAQRTPARGRRP